MGTATTLSIIAMTNSNIAMTNSNIALAQNAAIRKDQCKLMLEKYEAQVLTVEQKQTYAECIQVIYPQEVSPELIIVFKCLFVISLIGGAIGYWRACRDSYGGVSEYGMYTFIGMLITPLLASIIGGVVMGVKWLFS